MITTSSIMFAIIGNGSGLDYHPIYILLGIGFGAMFISWMNDSGFWVVAKLGGFTEKRNTKKLDCNSRINWAWWVLSNCSFFP